MILNVRKHVFFGYNHKQFFISFIRFKLLHLFLLSLFSVKALVKQPSPLKHHNPLFAKPRGSAATPILKRKVAVLGSGGYLGSLVFGFLQRAGSLFETGIAGGGLRAIGATSDTAVRLNRILSKHFVLAFADESYIKLTNLQSVQALKQRLQGWDALILGNEMSVQKRTVTANTYETTPNDKAFELYWDAIRGQTVDDEERHHCNDVVWNILNNVLQAAKEVGIQHIVAVDHHYQENTQNDFHALLEATGIPYTCLCLSGSLVDTSDYTFIKGIQGRLSSSLIDGNSMFYETQTEDITFLDEGKPIAREDLSALCVQILLSCDWSTSRFLKVYCSGPLTDDERKRASFGKRHDQEWCVASSVLEKMLQT